MFLRMNYFQGRTPTSIFIETPSLGKLQTKTKDPNLTLGHGYFPLDVNLVFQYKRGNCCIHHYYYYYYLLYLF